MAKTQLITPLELVDAIPDFEGREVVSVGVEVPSIAGGLQDAMTVSPVVLQVGDEIALVIIGRVKKISHEPTDKDDLDGTLRRVQVATCTEAGIVSVESASGLLTDQRDAIEAARVAAERAQGIHRLPMNPGTEDEDDEATVMARNHNAGNHQGGLVPGCPLCRLEAEFAAEENGTTVEEELEKRRAAE